MARLRAAQRDAPAPIPRGARSPARTYAALRKAHPDAHCELDHDSPFQLIVATVLSAQATDVSVNQITPALFRRWPTPAALARADVAEVEQALNRIGMFRQKAKNITRLAAQLVDIHGGEVPRTLTELVALPGVGRKTANVVLGVAFGLAEGVVVDTHVQRLSQRLGWTRHAEPEAIETDLMALFPKHEWPMLSHTLIFHGRRICTARSPQCASCPVAQLCPSAFKAESVGRKPPRSRAEPALREDAGAKAQARRSGASKQVAPAPRTRGATSARSKSGAVEPELSRPLSRVRVKAAARVRTAQVKAAARVKTAPQVKTAAREAVRRRSG